LDEGDSALPNEGSSAATCLPTKDPHVRWDAAARSLELPYSEEAVPRNFSTQLISGPFAYEVPQGAGSSARQVEFTGYACDAELPWDEDLHTVSVHAPGLNDSLRNGGGTSEALVWPIFGPDGVQARSTEVLMPRGGSAAIVELQPVMNGDASTGEVRQVVVGHARVTANSGEPVGVSRAAGPTQATADIADVTWCGDVPTEGLATYAISMTVFPDQLVDGEDDSPKLRFYPLG